MLAVKSDCYLLLFVLGGLSTFSLAPGSSLAEEREIATFAGGCFWCMEAPFDKLEGVVSTVSGYTGGHLEYPSYEQVSSGKSGHTEAVQVTFDPKRISYEKLLAVYWRNTDPTVIDRQFCDRGSQYRPEIFYHNDQQRRLAEQSKLSLTATKPFQEPILTPITKVEKFYPAEAYHQNYYLRNPLRYKYYRYRCGRDARLKALWGER